MSWIGNVLLAHGKHQTTNTVTITPSPSKVSKNIITNGLKHMEQYHGVII